MMSSCIGGGGERNADMVAADSDSIADTLSVDTFALPEEQPMPASADELFDDFFFNFAESERLQRSRTTFPLAVLADDVPIDTLDRNEWMMETFFIEQGNYVLILDSEELMDEVKGTTIDSTVVEKILFNTQTVRQFVFKRNHGVWKMVSVNNQPFYKNENAEFLTFYHKFSTDSLYQMRMLHDPLAFSSPDPDDDFARIEGVITPDSWLAFAPVLPVEGFFNISYGLGDNKKSDTKILVIRGISNGEETVLTFERKQGNWLLTKLDT